MAFARDRGPVCRIGRRRARPKLRIVEWRSETSYEPGGRSCLLPAEGSARPEASSLPAGQLGASTHTTRRLASGGKTPRSTGVGAGLSDVKGPVASCRGWTLPSGAVFTATGCGWGHTRLPPGYMRVAPGKGYGWLACQLMHDRQAPAGRKSAGLVACLRWATSASAYRLERH